MIKEMKNSVQKTVFTGVLAALLAVLSQISIPLPSGVPITLQTFSVALCGFVLGPVMGTAAVAVYLALGAVGLPVFAGFSGGFGVFVNLTGGFLWGFLPMAFVTGVGAKLQNKFLSISMGIAGMFICHVCGIVQFAIVMDMPLIQAFLVASAPYLIKDIISVGLAYFVALGVSMGLRKAGMGVQHE